MPGAAEIQIDLMRVTTSMCVDAVPRLHTHVVKHINHIVACARPVWHEQIHLRDAVGLPSDDFCHDRVKARHGHVWQVQDIKWPAVTTK